MVVLCLCLYKAMRKSIELEEGPLDNRGAMRVECRGVNNISGGGNGLEVLSSGSGIGRGEIG